MHAQSRVCVRVFVHDLCGDRAFVYIAMFKLKQTYRTIRMPGDADRTRSSRFMRGGGICVCVVSSNG